MAEYIKFAVMWLLFMVLLGVITVAVPKIAAKIDQSRKKYKDNKRENMFSFKETEFSGLSDDNGSEEPLKSDNGDAEN